MTKFDLLPASEQEELKQNIFFYHPESYALYDNGEFCPDVSLIPVQGRDSALFAVQVRGCNTNDDFQENKLQQGFNNVLWNEVHCYESKIDPQGDETRPNTKDPEKDKKLLKLFREIIDLSLTRVGKKRTYSTSSKYPTQTNPNPNWCLKDGAISQSNRYPRADSSPSDMVHQFEKSDV